MGKIRILHCIETISSGGVEKIRLLFAENLDFGKYELKIVCTNSSGPIKDKLLSLGIEIVSVGSFKGPLEWRKYRMVIDVIKRFRPHIIHGAVFEGMSMATIGGVLGKVPVIILEETSDPQTRSKKAILLQRVYSMFADMLIGISPSVLDFLRKKVGVSESKSILINNGVQVTEQINSKERKELRFKFGFGQDDIVIGSVGRVHNKIKRFSDLLEAVKLLDESRLKFLLVGSGPDLDSLKQKSKSLKIEKQFVSVGYQSETHNFYGIMDIFCLPSAHEGFGLVAAEAMLHHLPVVATNVGGLKDIVLDNQTGFLVSPFSPDQLAEKLKLLVENPELRIEFGEMGYQRALQHYTAERYCKEVENLYVELLKKRGIVT